MYQRAMPCEELGFIVNIGIIIRTFIIKKEVVFAFNDAVRLIEKSNKKHPKTKGWNVVVKSIMCHYWILPFISTELALEK